MRTPSEIPVQLPSLQTPQEAFEHQLRTIEGHVGDIVTSENPDIVWTLDHKTKWVTGTHNTTTSPDGYVEDLAISQRLGPSYDDRFGQVGYVLKTPNEELWWKHGETDPKEVTYKVINKFGKLERETRVPEYGVERFFGKVATSKIVQRSSAQ